MIDQALNAGIQADYVLMDTWFTTEPMIRSILTKGLDVIGMVKQLNQRHPYKDKTYTLPELQSMDLTSALQGSILLPTGIVSKVSANITEMLKSKVNDWMTSQPLFIQALFGDFYWKS